MTTRSKIWTGALMCAIGVTSMVGCSQGAESNDTFSFDLNGAKSDSISSARIIDKIPLNSKIEGRFNRTVKTYGFTFQAKAGARVTVGVATKAGSDSTDATPGAALDTVSVIHGPVRGNDKGPRLASADDANGRVDQQLPAFDVPADGEYVVAFSTWNDPGETGSYTVTVGCEGTDFQCARPIEHRECNPQTLYIQGGQPIAADTTWDNCEVVLLENTVVNAGAVLTVRPGVQVKGNFIAGAPPAAVATKYGTVGLDVQGQLQAIGRADQPILFTALKPDLGWRGLTLTGESSSLEHVFVENAETGVATVGSHQTMRDLDVSRCDQGVVLRSGQGTSIERIKVSQTRDAIHMDAGATGRIIDSVLQGVAKHGTGIQLTSTAAPTVFERSLVTGFEYGVVTYSAELVMNDSTIVGNRRGVHVSNVNPNERGIPSICPTPALPNVSNVPPPPPPVSGLTFRVDPVFTRCDVVRNDEVGVYIDAPQLLVIEDSNLVDNGKEGLVVVTRGLAPESRIRRTNITGNNGNGAEIAAFQQTGTLDITGNYWGVISDPELSASWNTRFVATATCPALTHRIVSQNSEMSLGDLNGWTCTNMYKPSGTLWGPVVNNGNRIPGGGWFVECTITPVNQQGNFTATVNMTGFSPVRLAAAGPRTADLCEDVRESRQESGL